MNNCEDCGNYGYYQNGYQQGKADAIDEYNRKIHKLDENFTETTGEASTLYHWLKRIDKIVEQLKERYMDKELVNHPEHYNKEGRKECWEEMIEIFGEGAVAVFDILNAYKYMYRMGDKDGNPAEQDYDKIVKYMEHATELLDKECCRTSELTPAYCMGYMTELLAKFIK